MSSPSEYIEDLAALHALGLLDEAGRRELFEAAQRDPEIDALMRDFSDSAALLAFEAPEVKPPAELRRTILAQLPARAAKSNTISFSMLAPYALAACLMFLLVSNSASNSRRLGDLNRQLHSKQAEITALSASDALKGMRLATLEVKDATYATARILVAWDSNRSRGLVSLENLPPAPTGHDYQLWALDPGAPAPVSAGIVRDARPFTLTALGTKNPGFAISLEPRGGMPAPTGPILFAVAPGP